MKNIENYDAAKYVKEGSYKEREQGIYEYRQEDETLYVTSLSFEQEPEYGEGTSAEEKSMRKTERPMRNWS